MNQEICKQLIHDFKLPIPIIPELYEYFFNLYNPLFHTLDLYDLLETESKAFESFDDFSQKMYTARSNIIDAISATEAYCKFNDGKNPDFFLPTGVPKYLEKTTHLNFQKGGNVYNPERVNKRYLSIDLEKANFQVLKIYNPDIVFGTQSYAELTNMFFKGEYMAKSKHNRQVIFGNLSPKRQIIVEKYYIGKIVTFLLNKGYFKEDDVCVLNNDEIIVAVNESFDTNICNEIFDEIKKEMGITSHVEVFDLRQVSNKYYVKEKTDGSIDFKGVPSHFFAQVYKSYLGQKLNKNDLAFMYEEQLCHFDSPIE